jgi:hypothetical protein
MLVPSTRKVMLFGKSILVLLVAIVISAGLTSVVGGREGDGVRAGAGNDVGVIVVMDGRAEDEVGTIVDTGDGVGVYMPVIPDAGVTAATDEVDSTGEGLTEGVAAGAD